MKNKCLYLFTILASVAFMNVSHAQGVDINKVNSVIKGIIDPIVAKDAFFDDLNFVLKPETDLNKNSASFELSASTKQAAWTTQSSSVTLTGNVAVTEVSATENNINANLKLAVETDVVAFANYANAIVNATAPCEANDFSNPGSSSTFFYNSFCNNLTHALKSQDFPTLKAEIAQIFSRVETEISDFIVYAEANNTEAYLIDNAKETLKDIQSIKVVENADSTVITINLYEFIDTASNNNGKEKIDIEFAITNQAASLSLNIDMDNQIQTISDVADYIKTQIQGLEQEDPEIKSYISSFAESYLELAKQFLTFQF